MAFLAELMGKISEAHRNAQMVPAALMSTGFLLGAAALSLIIFKAPSGLFLHLHGSAIAYSYYGILLFFVIYGLAVVSIGFWVVPKDPVGWHAAGKTLMWLSVLLLVLVAALGGVTLIK